MIDKGVSRDIQVTDPNAVLSPLVLELGGHAAMGGGSRAHPGTGLWRVNQAGFAAILGVVRSCFPKTWRNIVY